MTPPTVSGTLVQPTTTSGTLFINEALLVPHSTWNCSELGTYTPTNDTWVEIYNAQDQPFDLYSVHTSIDSGPNTNPFYLPFGSAIAPHGFLVVFPRLDPNFLATETATWRLLIGGIAVDTVTLPSLGEDQAYARVPDGSQTWIITSTPTIDASNTTSVMPPTPTMTKAEATAVARTHGSNKGGRSNRGGTSGRGSGGTYVNGDGTVTIDGQQIDGVQPSWSSLQHPDTVPTSSAATLAGNPTVQASTGGLDVPHKILLTLLVATFAAALFWCLRLFHVP
ncbi:MAG: hypothetical protein NVS4B11_15910 [Ktedonobacteraceae bacterium]